VYCQAKPELLSLEAVLAGCLLVDGDAFRNLEVLEVLAVFRTLFGHFILHQLIKSKL